MKKLIAFLLMTIIAVSLFACGGNDDTTAGEDGTQGGTQGGSDNVTVTTLAPGETDVDNEAAWPSDWN